MLHVTNFQFLLFFNIQEKTKNNPRCIVPIYVLSMCKSKIAFIEGLPRYRPYKLMTIARLHKKFLIISQISHVLNCREKSKLPPPPSPLIAQLQYMFSPCARGKLNTLRGYWYTGRTSSWILQVYIRNFTIFLKFPIFFQFSRKIKTNPPLQSSIICSL